ncbi:MAG: cation:proton antiporter [Nanoarchaeota archaeon]
MASIFFQISLVLAIVLIVSFIMRFLKQPLIIGYIISGIIVGPLFFNLISNFEIISTFSEFGIAFLLFIVGIHLSPKVIKEVGKISLITGVGQVVFTSIAGYFIGIALGFDNVTSLYVAVALTFSSTIIIMKLLSDKDAIDKLYGKISIGFLLVQDLIAILALLFISSFSNGDSSQILISTFLKGFLAFAVLIPLSKYALPKLGGFFAKSQEILFVFALAWGLGVSSLFFYLGFSIEAGALIAGVMLSISPYSYEISSKLKPLRDFFVILFFILLGSQMVFIEISKFLIPAVVFSLFILVGNPLIFMILMGLFGYNKNISFMSGLTIAQISEFSLILIALGVKLGHIPQGILSFVAIVGLITIAGSTYMVMYSEKIYSRVSKYLYIFERKNVKKDDVSIKDNDYILFGENRIGFSVMNAFKEIGKRYLIVDFNPERIKKLSKEGVNCVYGDISDLEFVDSLRIEKSKLIVSTVPDFETNLMILRKIRRKNKESVVIVTARQIHEAFELYKNGADYVILPHFLGGEYAARIIEKFQEDKKSYEREKNRQIKDLKARIEEGQEHPKTEKR